MSYQTHKDDIQKFLQHKIKKLNHAGISNAHNEIKWLLQKFHPEKSEDFIFKKNFILNKKQFKKLNGYIIRRLNHEPFQHIIKSAPFYGLDLYVDSKVLIPRPESEIFIDIIKKKQKKFQSALDIGTGSGNLALSIAINKLSNLITAIDISNYAIKIAKKNFYKYNIDYINCYQSNFLNMKFKEKFDLIVSNPPYISLNEYQKLDKTVKNFEPKKSLTDGSTGLMFYQKIAQLIPSFLRLNGILLIEIGLERNKTIIENIFKSYSIKWHKDLQKNNRVIEIQK